MQDLTDVLTTKFLTRALANEYLSIFLKVNQSETSWAKPAWQYQSTQFDNNSRRN